MRCRGCAPRTCTASRAHLSVVKVVHSKGSRIRAFREHLGLNQNEAASRFGVPKGSYQKYEMDLSSPGSEAIEKLVRAGINANWLLTGEGPMLLADLVPPVVKPADPKINVDALEAIIEGALKIAPNAPASRIAAHSASLYKRCIEEGMITADGIGNGNLNAAA